MKMRAITQRILTAAAMAAFAAFATGPVPAQVKGVVIKGKAPVNKKPLKVTLPKAFETTLPNGLQVVVLENHKLPTFSVQMVILSGGFADAAGSEGAAQYVATMLREGTKTRNSRQIAEAVDSLGATLNAASGLASLTTNVVAGGLTDQLDQIMELFADILLNPSFPQDEFDKLKTRQLANLSFQRSQPNFLAGEMFAKAMYGAHPASRFALTEEQIKRFTPEALKAYHDKYYKPNNAIFAIVGDVKPAEVTAKLEKLFGSWQKAEVPPTTIPKAPETGAAKIHLIDRANSQQTNLILGTQTIERSDPDYYALDLMNQIVGGGASARLFLNLREDKGYTYGAYSAFTANKYRGVFRAATEVRPDVTKASMDELMYEFKRIRDEKTPQDEFDRAKFTIIGSFALQLESPQSLLGNIMTQKIYGLPADYWDVYPQKIAAVTQDDVQRVARKYLDLTKLQVVAVGDAKIIAEPLKQFGAVEIFDTEGKPKTLAAPEAPKTTGATGPAPAATTAELARLVGLWTLDVVTPDGPAQFKLEMKPNGSQIGGMLDTPFGQFPVVGASLEGSDVKVKIKAEMQGNSMDVMLNGKLDGPTMKGQLSSASLPTVDFTGKKAK
jgi:zinc protease